MKSSAAKRMRLSRARRRLGQVVVRCAVDEVALEEQLVSAGLLRPGADVSRGDVERALELWLAALLHVTTADDEPG